MSKVLCAAIMLLAGTSVANAQGGTTVTKAPSDVVSSLAPTGKLRAAINFGNGVLAQKDPATGEPAASVSISLRRSPSVSECRSSSSPSKRPARCSKP